MKPRSRISPYVRTVTAALLLMLSLGALTSCKPKYATGLKRFAIEDVLGY